MAGYFGKRGALLDLREFGHRLPPDPEPGQLRVFAFGRWMSYDEWILERVAALGREKPPPREKPVRQARPERLRSGLLFAQNDDPSGGFDERGGRARGSKKRPQK